MADDEILLAPLRYHHEGTGGGYEQWENAS
jgi:hypothetical protein